MIVDIDTSKQHIFSGRKSMASISTEKRSGTEEAIARGKFITIKKFGTVQKALLRSNYTRNISLTQADPHRLHNPSSSLT